MMLARTLCIGMALSLALAGGAQAQRNGPLANQMIDAAANKMVQQIQSSDCASFASMLQSHKNGNGGSKKSSRLKQNPAARARFVNTVAGPLLNKMIDCDMLPGG
jgi:hypothetical protein